MLVLILAIASFLFFVLVMTLLAIASTLESRTLCRKRILRLTKPLVLLSINDAFDPIYSVLWQAPIAALEIIDSGGPSGVPIARLRPIYEAAAAHFPEIYDGCSFMQWLEFLENTRLISRHGYNVVLAPDGHAFLRFRFVSEALVEA